MGIQKAFVVKNSLEVDQNLFYVDSISNKVGVGTSTPAYLFDVSGTAKASNLFVPGIGTFSSKIIVGASGNNVTAIGASAVGIGTSSPSKSLDVFGTARVTGLITTNNLYASDGIVGVLTVATTANLSGNIIFGSDNSKTATFNARVNSDIIPSSTTSDLGSSGNKWGNVYANNFIGTFTGNADTSTKLSIATTTTNANHYITFVSDTSSGTAKTVYADSNLLYNPSTNLLTVSKLAINGDTTIGIATTNSIAVNGRFTSDLIPLTDGSVSLGSSTRKWDSIYVNRYLNFEFSDLPTTGEPTFAKERLLKVNSSGNGYEFIDILNLNTFQLRGFGISNDPTVYVGVASTVSNKLQISGISTSRLFIGEKVKVFGLTSNTDNTLIDAPLAGSCSATKVGLTASGSTYRYWISQYNLRNGKVGVSSQISPVAGIAMTTIDGFNSQNYISLTLARTDVNHGLLIYRQIGVSTNINDAKLIAILGPKELSNSTAGINWIDYGIYDQTDWSSKGTVNEYTSNQIHFPNIATTGHRRGWIIDEIVSIGQSSITLANPYKTNIGIGTTSIVRVVHDSTCGLSSAIDSAVSLGKNSLELPSGTYITNKIILPSGFTLKGNGRNTLVKQQYFATDLTDGGGNSLAFDGNMVGFGTTNPTDITIQDITFDGNSGNNILFNNDLDNYLLYFENINSSYIQAVEVRNAPANSLYSYNSKRLSIENSSFVDGSLTDRYDFSPLNAQESETLRVNNCLFENHPGPVDLSVTSIVSTGGNIIRNCGTGLRTYATGKINTTNNIILGPADEWIPTPDIYDSDYNSVNMTIQRGNTFNGPVLLYVENGLPKDISSGKVSISSGIGTIVGQGTTNETLGSKFLNFNIITPDAGTNGRQNGYIQLGLTASQTSTLGITSSLGYEIIGTEYLSTPTGLTTSVGISTGVWNLIGVGATNYTITLEDPTQFPAVSVGDVIKLIGHSVSPDLSPYTLTVSQKLDVDSITKQLVLTGFALTSISNGNNTGYITIRNIFTIAKGRVGVI